MIKTRVNTGERGKLGRTAQDRGRIPYQTYLLDLPRKVLWRLGTIFQSEIEYVDNRRKYEGNIEVRQ